MDIRKLQRAIVDGLEDVKAQDIAGVQHRASVAAVRARDRRVGHSQPADQGAGRQRARCGASEPASPTPRTEGEDNGEWIIVDCGAAVVAHHAAGDPRVLPPRRDLGRQAGADEARRRAKPTRLVKARADAERSQAAARPGALRRSQVQGRVRRAPSRPASAPAESRQAPRPRARRRRPPASLPQRSASRAPARATATKPAARARAAAPAKKTSAKR